MSRELDVAIKAAKEAGKLLLDYFEKGAGKKIMKDERDFSTEADHAAEKVILDIITKAFPDRSILAEEAGATDKKSDCKWIIDPLDGTHNFAWGFPIWATGIALEKRGEIIAAVSYAPQLGQMFTAEKGKGAFLNGKRIKVSDRAYPHCMIAFGGSWSVGKEPLVKENFPRLFEKFYHRFKVIGSAVYAEACVAAGILDAYPCFMENPWDVASGILLVQEAGGTVTDIYGNPPTPYQKHYIFSNKPLHEEVRRTLKV